MGLYLRLCRGQWLFFTPSLYTLSVNESELSYQNNVIMCTIFLEFWTLLKLRVLIEVQMGLPFQQRFLMKHLGISYNTWQGPFFLFSIFDRANNSLLFCIKTTQWAILNCTVLNDHPFVKVIESRQ